MRKKRSTDKPEIRLKQNERNRRHMMTKRLFEDSETKIKENRKNKQRMKHKRLTEDLHTKQKNNEKKREYMKSKRSIENVEGKRKRNEYMKEYKKKKRVSKFSHEIASRGPIYVCTCCDQLWYKHSVTLAQNLKTTNPEISKFLLNKTSVDHLEWLCNTCQKYLKQNKLPHLHGGSRQWFAFSL